MSRRCGPHARTPVNGTIEIVRPRRSRFLEEVARDRDAFHGRMIHPPNEDFVILVIGRRCYSDSDERFLAATESTELGAYP